jgi:hypothetical protein
VWNSGGIMIKRMVVRNSGKNSRDGAGNGENNGRE